MPNQFTVSYNEDTFVVDENETILEAALQQGIDIPHSCQVGSCTSCLCTLVTGSIDVISDVDYVLTPEQLEANAMLACQSLPTSDLVITSVEEAL